MNYLYAYLRWVVFVGGGLYAMEKVVGTRFPTIAKWIGLVRKTYLLPGRGMRAWGKWIAGRALWVSTRKLTRFWWNAFLLRKLVYHWDHWAWLLLHDVITGNLPIETANKVLNSSSWAAKINGKTYQDIYVLLKEEAGLELREAQVLLGKNSGINYLANKSLRGQLLSHTFTRRTVRERLDPLSQKVHRYTRQGDVHLYHKIEDFNTTFRSWWKEKKQFVKTLFDRIEFVDLADIENFKNNMNAIPDSYFVWKNFDEVVIDDGDDILKHACSKDRTIFQQAFDTKFGRKVATEEIDTVASYLSKNRYLNKWIPEGFEQGGKFEKYAKFRQDYDDALKIADEPIRAKRLLEIDKAFAEQLLKDGNKLEDILSLTVEQKAIFNSVDEGLASLNAKKARLQKSSWKNPKTIEFYDNQIKNFNQFRNTIHELPDEEIKAFAYLKWKGLKVPHIVELLEFNKPGSRVEKALLNSNFDELIDAVKAEKKIWFKLSEQALEADELIKWLRVISKLKIAGEISEAVEYLGRVLKLLSKFKI